MKRECHTDRIQKSIEMRFLFPYTKIPVRAVQGRRKFYYGRALSKIIGHHGWLTINIFKIMLAKMP